MKICLITVILFLSVMIIGCYCEEESSSQGSGNGITGGIKSAWNSLTKSNSNDENVKAQQPNVENNQEIHQNSRHSNKEPVNQNDSKEASNNVRNAGHNKDKNEGSDEPGNSSSDTMAPKKEKGTWSGVPRNVVKGIGQGASKVSSAVGSAVGTAVEKGKDAVKYFTGNTGGGLDSNKTFFSGAIDAFKDQLKTIYPGTQWCGGGTKAKTYDDLGTFADTDKCCRDHDLCDDNINAGETKYGLHNTGLFTRSHCDCDFKFHKCLKDAKSVISYNIGFTYFTVLGPQCFKEDYPVTDCKKWKNSEDNSKKICTEYILDKSATPVHQWFDNDYF